LQMLLQWAPCYRSKASFLARNRGYHLDWRLLNRRSRKGNKRGFFKLGLCESLTITYFSETRKLWNVH
jgi:hypothetical protein